MRRAWGLAIFALGALGALVPAESTRTNLDELVLDAFGPGFHLRRERRADGALEDFVDLPRALPGDRLHYRLDVGSFAGLRLVEGTNALELLDARGAPRLRMEPPFVLDRERRPQPVRVAVHGCSVDTDPRPPWGRAVTPPGATSCDLELAWSLSPAAYPAVLDPAWITTKKQLLTHRAGHTATLLASGLVLVVAGRGADDDLMSAELFDPVTETFASTKPLHGPRRAHTAARLVDGRVLVAGGYVGLVQPIPPLASMERWDPTTGEWTELPPLTSARAHHTMNVLKDGRVLISGGYDDLAASAITSVELCSKDGTACHGSAPLPIARADHSASLLQDGRVLVAGGAVRIYNDSASFHSSSVIYQPVGESWTAGPSLPFPRIGHVDVVLPNGRVLFFGGASKPQGEVLIREIVSWDPPDTTMSVVGNMGTERWLHSVSLLGSGRVIIAGTCAAFYAPSTIGTTELFDPSAREPAPAGMITPRHLHTATTLADGRVLVLGGGGSSAAPAAFIFSDPVATPPTPEPEPAPSPPSQPPPPPPFVSDASVSPAPAPNRESTSFYACATHSYESGPAGPWAALGLLCVLRRRRR